jgi:eukaryotic-like serine/threonine-protein kinase
MTNLVGSTLLERYRIEESLGRGGMAEVYKAWDMQRATYLALKVLRQDLSRDLVFLRRFQREAHTLAKLQHPNIVRFYGIETDHLTVFMLMDFIAGSTLQDEIFLTKGQPLAQDHIWLVLNSICSALHYAHSMGLVHCDIKPGNIMINQHSEVLLTDFGIARMTDTATATMVGFGTPAYMAPELVGGQDPTPQSDIYSLGIVLYEMITGGERPFTGERAQTTGPTSEKVRWEQLHLAPPSPRAYNPAISEKLESVITRCLAKEPQKRFPTPLDLLNALDLALEKRGSAATVTVHSIVTPGKSEPFRQYNQHGVGEVNQSSGTSSLVQVDKSEQKSIQRTPIWAVWTGGAALLIITLGAVIGLLVRDRGQLATGVAAPTEVAVILVQTPIATATDLPVTTATLTQVSSPTPTETSMPTLEPTLGVGSTMANPVDGALLAFIPEGEFLMGSESSDSWEHEAPQHFVHLDSYWISIHEVTNAQFQMFVQDTGYRTTAEQRGASFLYIDGGWVEVDGVYWSAPFGPGSTLSDRETHPVIHVTWFDAVAYCEWAGGRLPTEAEWEKAARGEDGGKYPWGDTNTVRGYANYCDRDCPFEVADIDWNDGYAYTAPVGSYPSGASPFGLFDMAGNVWEMVQDWYNADYYSQSPGRNPEGPTLGNRRVLRGGSWGNGEEPLRTSFRYWYDPMKAFPFYGFRCAHTPTD